MAGKAVTGFAAAAGALFGAAVVGTLARGRSEVAFQRGDYNQAEVGAVTTLGVLVGALIGSFIGASVTATTPPPALPPKP